MSVLFLLTIFSRFFSGGKQKNDDSPFFVMEMLWKAELQFYYFHETWPNWIFRFIANMEWMEKKK